jgi:exonuclease VII large subunit
VRVLTVSELTAELAKLLGDRYPAIEVEGEVSQLAIPASGHAYLTLTDGESVLGAVAWRAAWQGMVWTPKRGDRVVCRGKIGVYPGKGAYQLYVHTIRKAGEGALAAEIARRKARLEAEGLLDPRRKRALPAMPRFVGVGDVADRRGAAGLPEGQPGPVPGRADPGVGVHGAGDGGAGERRRRAGAAAGGRPVGRAGGHPRRRLEGGPAGVPG